jgi:heme exporter protein CcmD
MIPWLQNPQASYVFAAYGVAGIGLIGLLLASLCAARRTRRAWQKLQEKRDKGRA